MNVRRATTSDLDSLVTLGLLVHALHLDARDDEFRELSSNEVMASFETALNDEKQAVMLACENDKALGYLLLRIIERPENPFQKARTIFYIDQLSVLEQNRKQGVGRMLMEAAKDFADERGCNRLLLDVWAFNKKALRFFISQGFESVKLMMEYQPEK